MSGGTKDLDAPPSYSQAVYNEPQSQAPYVQILQDPTSDPGYGYGDRPILVPAVIPQEPYVEVPDYHTLSIISVFCCTAFGVFSIIKSSNARQMKTAGRYQSALAEARKARVSAVIAILIGSIIVTLVISLRVILAV